MKNEYSDITSRILEPPTWWDCNGVPRYGDFHPGKSPSIYAKEIVLLRIMCQGCGCGFDVEVNWSEIDFYHHRPALSGRLRGIYYGDPPNVGCCPAGPTMSSISVRTLQFWRREGGRWERWPEGEDVDIENPADYDLEVSR